MPLEIGQVDVQMEQAGGDTAPAAAPTGSLPISDAELRERVRPMILEILDEEMAKFRRWQQG